MSVLKLPNLLGRISSPASWEGFHAVQTLRIYPDLEPADQRAPRSHAESTQQAQVKPGQQPQTEPRQPHFLLTVPLNI